MDSIMRFKYDKTGENIAGVREDLNEFCTEGENTPHDEMVNGDMIMNIMVE